MADQKNYFQRRTKDRGPRSNNRISSPEVQVIGSDGNNLGILNTNEAINKAMNLKLKEITNSLIGMGSPSDQLKSICIILFLIYLFKNI